MHNLFDLVCNIDIDQPNKIGDVELALRSIKGWENYSITSLKMMFEQNNRLGLIVIGFWSFDFLKNPQFSDAYLLAYNEHKLDGQAQRVIMQGLLEIINCCRIDVDYDEDAIDYHYSSVCKLYRFARANAESFIVENLIKKPSIQLIEALGVLVGYENQGFLKDETIDFLKVISHENNELLSKVANRVLNEDIVRVMGKKIVQNRRGQSH